MGTTLRAMPLNSKSSAPFIAKRPPNNHMWQIPSRYHTCYTLCFLNFNCLSDHSNNKTKSSLCQDCGDCKLRGFVSLKEDKIIWPTSKIVKRWRQLRPAKPDFVKIVKDLVDISESKERKARVFGLVPELHETVKEFTTFYLDSLVVEGLLTPKERRKMKISLTFVGNSPKKYSKKFCAHEVNFFIPRCMSLEERKVNQDSAYTFNLRQLVKEWAVYLRDVFDETEGNIRI